MTVLGFGVRQSLRALALCLAAWAIMGAPILAAQGLDGALHISRLDASRAPVIEASVVVRDAFGKPIAGLKADNFVVSENGKAVPAPSINAEEVGLQLAAMIYSGNNPDQAGLSGKSWTDERHAVLSDLLLSGSAVDNAGRSDWVTIMAPDQSGLKTLTEDAAYPNGWTNDYQLAYNKVYQYSPTAQSANPSLAGTIAAGLRKSEETLPNDNSSPRQRILVVFAGANDSISLAEYHSLASAARRAHVVVYPLIHGTPGDGNKLVNLVQFANATGGFVTEYSGRASIEELLQTIKLQHTQYSIRYRMLTAGNHNLRIQATVEADGNSTPLSDEITFADKLAPAGVKLSAPTAGAVIEKYPKAPQKALPIALRIAWPNGLQRGIASVEYYIDQTPYVVKQAPFDQFSLALEMLGDGPHTLRAEVTDEFGLHAATDEIPIEVKSLQPLAVSVDHPLGNSIVNRKTTAWLAKVFPLGLSAQDEQVMQSTWEPVDGRARRVDRVEYLVDGQVQYRANGDAAQGAWNAGQFTDGPHMLQVRFTDELGFVSESSPVPVTVQTFSVSLSLMAFGVLALGALLAIAYLYYQRRPMKATGRRKPVPVRAGNPRLAQGLRPTDGHSKLAEAYLFVREADSTYRAEPIPLISSNTRIGRDHQLVNLYFADRTVSRLHARISKELDGIYHVYDEGSTSGTLVNGKPVPMSGEVVHQNDIIRMGRISLRFSLADAPDEAWLSDREESSQVVAEHEGQPAETATSQAWDTEHFILSLSSNGHNTESGTTDDATTDRWSPAGDSQ